MLMKRPLEHHGKPKNNYYIFGKKNSASVKFDLQCHCKVTVFIAFAQEAGKSVYIQQRNSKCFTQAMKGSEAKYKRNKVQ